MTEELPHSIHGVLKRNPPRAIDRVIRQFLRQPGVLRQMWTHLCATRIGKLHPESRGKEIAKDDHAWLDKGHRGERADWSTSLTARLGDDSIAHFEQRTEHDECATLRNQMNSAASLSTHFDFRKKVFQVYYYTGTEPLVWDVARVEDGLVTNANGSVLNRFLVIDANDHDSAGMFSVGDFNYAVLGLLGKITEDSEYRAGKLVTSCRNQFRGENLVNAFAMAIALGFRRGWSELIWAQLSGSERHAVAIAPFWTKFESTIPDVQANLSGAIFRLFEKIKANVAEEVPMDVLAGAIIRLSAEDIAVIESKISAPTSLDELLEGTAIDPHRRPHLAGSPMFSRSS